MDHWTTKSDKIKRNSVSGQTRNEEIANSILHGTGIALSIAALIVLVVMASRIGDVWKIVSFSVYGTSLLILYTVSTIYHSMWGESLKRLFLIFDHMAIFLLIAGTYTPFLLINLRGVWGWSLFGTIWGLAIVGIVYKSIRGLKGEWLSLFIYLAMGWLIVVASRQMVEAIPLYGIAWLIIGGLLYTLGAVFFMLDRKIPYGHAIWHTFVLGGSISHFISILYYT